MGSSARHSALLAITVAAAMCIDAGSADLYAVSDFSEGGGSIYSYGKLNLNSPSSARSVGAAVHSWTDKDLPGLSEHYCGPNIAVDAHGVVYAFAGSSCVDDNGFFPAAILAYDMVKNTTKVYGDIPKPSYRGAAIGPGFGATFLDESTGVFYVVTSSNVDTYDFSLSMLLEFDPQSGNFTVLLTLPALSFMTSCIFDAESHLVVVGIDQPYDTIVKKTAIFDTRSRDLTYLNISSDDLPAYVGVDPVGGKTLVIQEQDVGPDGKIKTNYEFGHLTCSNATGCAFTSLGELDRMWCGPIPEYGNADGIIGIAWDPAERLLSVQSTGCYNLTIVDNNGPFNCYSNLGTEKFYQYQLPSAATNLSASIVTPKVQCIPCAAGGGPANCNVVPCADDDDCDGWCNGPGTRHGTSCTCYLGASCTDGAPGNCLNSTSHASGKPLEGRPAAAFAVLRTYFFQEHLLLWSRDVQATAHLRLPLETACFAPLHQDDGAAVVASMANFSVNMALPFRGKIFNLTGPQVFGGPELAQIAAAAIPLPGLAFTEVNRSSADRILNATGNPGVDGLLDLLGSQTRECVRTAGRACTTNCFGLPSPDFHSIVGREPTSISTFFANNADAFRPAASAAKGMITTPTVLKDHRLMYPPYPPSVPPCCRIYSPGEGCCPKGFRFPYFLHHLNLSVVPNRCGHIDIEPLLPPELSDEEVFYYFEVTLDILGDNGIGWLHPGECGKVYHGPCGDGSDGASVKFKKRNNPASAPTPWLTAGNGGQLVPAFASECLSACNCTLHPAASDSGLAAKSRTEAPPCSDVYPNPNPHPKPNRDPNSLTGMCEVACGQAFNDKLANSTVQLWCDPNDPNCAPNNDGH